MTDHSPLTAQQLDNIDARQRAATPGPWTLSEDYSDVLGPDGDQLASYWNPTSETRNGEFIAHAREDVPLLLAEIRRQRTQVISIEGAADRYAARASEYQAALEATFTELLAVQVEREAARAEVARLRARRLTEREYSAAWHAVEGAAGEEGADPGTVLHAVLDRLGIDLPSAEGTPAVAEADTLPAWLYQRFAVIHGMPAWDRIGDADRAYWEHQARAVRRAVARNGFKAAGEETHVVADGGDGPQPADPAVPAAVVGGEPGDEPTPAEAAAIALADINTVWASWTTGRLTTDDAMTAIRDHLTTAREQGALK